MKLSYLIRGMPGHPLHPPLTDATIGAFTFATVAKVYAPIVASVRGGCSGCPGRPWIR